MSRCNHCKVEILDNAEYCPLCHNVLENGKNGEDTYPNVIKKQKKLNFVMRLLTFFFFAITIVSIFINYSTNQRYWWSVVVGAVFLYALWIIGLAARDIGYLHRIFSGTIGGILLVVLIDVIFGFLKWSVNFVLPGTMLLIDLVLIILMIVNKRNWQSYMLCQILMIVFGILGLILIYTGVVSHPLVTEIAFLTALIAFLGSLILGGHTARVEMRRRFHI